MRIFCFFILFLKWIQKQEKIERKKSSQQTLDLPFFLLDFVRSRQQPKQPKQPEQQQQSINHLGQQEEAAQTKAERHFRTVRPSLTHSFDLRAFASFHWHTSNKYFVGQNDNYITFWIFPMNIAKATAIESESRLSSRSSAGSVKIWLWLHMRHTRTFYQFFLWDTQGHAYFKHFAHTQYKSR